MNCDEKSGRDRVEGKDNNSGIDTHDVMLALQFWHGHDG